MHETTQTNKGFMDESLLLAIQRHWVWADKMREQFRHRLPSLLKEFEKHGDFFPISDGFVYMSLWYGLLFSVLEAMKKAKIVIPSIAADIKKVYDKLRWYRNAVFHVQKQYWPSKKYMPLINYEETSEIVHRIHKEVEAFLVRETQRILSQRPSTQSD